MSTQTFFTAEPKHLLRSMNILTLSYIYDMVVLLYIPIYGRVLMTTAKKWIMAIVMSASLLSATPVIASEKTSSNKTISYASIGILDSLKELLPELKDYHILEVGLGKDGFENGVIYMLVGKSDEKKDQAQLTIDLKTAEITDYSGYKDSPPASDSLAAKKASAFLKKLVGNDRRNYVVKDTQLGTVIYCKTVKGIPFVDAGYSIFVDSNGRIYGFHKNWNGEVYVERDFPSPSKAISKEEAKKSLPEYLKNSPLQLVYMIKSDKKPHLIYKVISDIEYATIDAITGELIVNE